MVKIHLFPSQDYTTTEKLWERKTRRLLYICSPVKTTLLSKIMVKKEQKTSLHLLHRQATESRLPQYRKIVVKRAQKTTLHLLHSQATDVVQSSSLSLPQFFCHRVVFGQLPILGRLPVSPEHSWSWDTMTIKTQVPT